MNKKRIPLLVVAALVLAAVSAIAFMRWNEQRNYQPRTEDFGVVKFNPQTQVLTYTPKKGKPSKEFPDLVPFSKQFVKGLGAKLVLVRDPNLPDSGAAPREFVIEPNLTYRAKSESARKRMLKEEKWPELEQLKEWLMSTDRKPLVEVGGDNTEGMPPDLVNQINSTVKSANIPALIPEGSTNVVRVHSWPIGETEFGTNNLLELNASNVGSYETLLTEAFKQSIFFIDYFQGPVEHSAVAESILRFTSENPNYPDRLIYIFSDGVQNTPKFSLYGRQALLNPKKVDDQQTTFPGYAEIDKVLWADETGDLVLPPVRGAVIHWYAPPTSRFEPALVRKALAYWKNVLERAGARVTIH